MHKKVIIASDSTSDLSPDLIEKYHVQILPLGVSLGDKQYTDGVDIDPELIYSHYSRTGELPKTSAPNLSACLDFFKQLTAEGCAVVFFTIASGMSSTYSNARTAAAECEDVFVVDTKNLSTGGGLLVIAAAEMAEKGSTAKEIADECARLADYVDASFVVDNLEFLHKGGRCSSLDAFGANLLQLKPCIVVRNGKMFAGKKYRGKFAYVLKKYIAEQLGDGSDLDLTRVFVTHAGCDEAICRQCVEQIRELAPFQEILLTCAGCTVSSHCGRNTLGVLFIRKTPLK